MKLLLINYEYPPVGGGAGNATAAMARALVELGHSATVLTAAYDSQPTRSRVDGVDIIRVPARRARPDRSGLFEMATYVAVAAIALPRVLRAERPDASIVFFSMPCGPLGLLGRWWARIPYIISLRGGDVPGTESSLGLVYSLLAPMRRLVLRKAVAVVANSTGLKALSEAADPIGVQVVPNGVDTEFFHPARARDDRPFTFLFVGRFQSQKNLPFLLDAIAGLRREAAVQFRVVLVGDGPLRAELQQRSAACGLADIVTWCGWCSKEQLLVHYHAADCFVNPSLYEGMPNTVLEAMACGLPVLASNVPGNDAVVWPGETGFLFPLGDSSQLVTAMRRLLGDASMARNMGDTARARVGTDFSWKSVARRYVELIADQARPSEVDPRNISTAMAPLFISNIEYVTLRLARRFLFPKDLHNWGRYLPFYRTNLAETQPDHVCQLYVDGLALAHRSVVGERVVEVGSGATNSAGYALVCAGATRVWCVEPYIAFDRDEDAILLDRLARRYSRDRAEIAAAVSRCRSFDSVGAGNADIIVSHSVLEHVVDLTAVFSDMRTALATGGAMLHIVDYRDHFFKYPLHFLQFSTRTWRRFLDPGDLPRWRLSHHLMALDRAGFDTRVMRQEVDAREFERIRVHISSDFDLEDPRLGVLHAILYCERKNPESLNHDVSESWNR